MTSKKNLSRRTFALGLLATGVCEAATPLIDMSGRKTPLINVSSNPNFLRNSLNKEFNGLNNLYFDPEPELQGNINQLINHHSNSIFRPQRSFSLNLRNTNTSETYAYKINASFFNNELNYDMLDYFFRDWRENKTIKMDRGVIKNFLKVF